MARVLKWITFIGLAVALLVASGVVDVRVSVRDRVAGAIDLFGQKEQAAAAHLGHLCTAIGAGAWVVEGVQHRETRESPESRHSLTVVPESSSEPRSPSSNARARW